MKLAYVLKADYSVCSFSIFKKVVSQIKALQNCEIETSIYVISNHKGVNLLNEKEVYKIYENHNDSFEESNIIKKMYFMWRNIDEINNLLKLDKPDVIYLRDCGFQFNLHKKLSQIAPLFVEIQTKLIEELKILNNPRYYIETLLHRNYLKFSQGLICVTNEIKEYELKFNNKPCFVVGNGIDNEDIYFVEKKNENDMINLLFVGSPNLTWHGVDRLIRSFLKAPNKEKFFLHIVGYNDVGIRDKNVRCYGYVKDKKVINELIAKCDIGIGSLALYRINIREAAPLKVREYLAKGLPVIIGYDDVDLNGEEFVYKVSNDNSDIDFTKIEEFYRKHAKNFRYNVSGINTAIYAKNNLNWDIKMKKVVEFIKSQIY